MAAACGDDGWRALFAVMADGCAFGEAIFDAAGKPVDLRLLDMNPAFERQSGWSRAMLGQPVSSWLQERAAFGLERCLAVAATGEPARSDYRNASAGRCYEIQAYPHRAGGFVLLCRDTGEQQRREQALRDSERNTWQVLESLPSLIWTATAEGEVDFVSPQWSAYTGTPGTGRLGKRWTEVVHPDDQPAAYAVWHAAVVAQRGWDHECRLRGRDGGYRWFAWRGAPIRDAAGKVVRWFGMFTDIDDLKRIQEELQQSERRYSALFHNKTNAIAHCRVVADEQGKPVDFCIERVNEANQRITGLRREDIEGRLATQSLPEFIRMDFDFIGEFGRIGLEGGEGSFEVQYPPTGQWLSLYVYSPVRGEFTVMFYDVTPQKQAEAALRESEEALRATFEQAAVGIAHISPQGFFLRVNRTLCRMVGYEEQDLCGRHFTEMAYPADRDIGKEAFQRTVAGEAASYVVDKRYQRRDGALLWVRITGSTVRDAGSGQAKYNVVVIEDITAQKQAEQTRETMLAQLRHAVADANHSRANMEAVFQSIGDGISVFDMEGNLRLLNAALARINSYPDMEDMLRHLDYFAQTYELTLPDGAQVPLRQWPVSRVLRGESFSDWELQVHRRDTGRSYYCSFSGAPVYDGDGRQSMAVVITRDVSERRRMEQTRQETERRLQLAVDIAHLGFWEWHVAADTCYFSPQWKKQLGYQDHELPSLASEWRARLHPDDHKRVMREVAAYVEHPQAGYQMEYRLRHRDGSYRWMIANAIPSGSGPGMTLIGTQLDITDSKLAEQRVLAAAQHDPLTGLPNRALAFEYAGHLLAGARRNHSQGAFLFIDLDRFKPVNDLYGHETGDRLLQEVAKRLKACVRSEDLVGRLGGDEFVLVLPHVGNHHPAEAAAQHVIDALSCPFEIDALDLSISASIGISHFPLHGTNVDALIHAADLAMYQAKQGRHGNYAVYTPELDNRADASSSIEAKLKRALKRNGLTLHYQPVIDMKSGEVIGAEALLRMKGEGSKTVGPDRFIPVAESAGLIGDLGEWVATEACRQHEAWRHQGLPPVTIAINVSPLQFRQRGFARRLQDIILDSSIDPEHIQIEVTESTVMESVEDAIETLRLIRAAGIRIALDDFGTGYSSLSHLSNLPLDKLKVDQSFVQRLEHDRASRAITGAIITLGRTLNLEVVGEGIESKDALDYLQEHGCDQAQGFFISQPLPPDQFAEWYRGRYMQ